MVLIVFHYIFFVLCSIWVVVRTRNEKLLQTDLKQTLSMLDHWIQVKMPYFMATSIATYSFLGIVVLPFTKE